MSTKEMIILNSLMAIGASIGSVFGFVFAIAGISAGALVGILYLSRN